MEIKNLNMYQRLRDFDVPATVLDEIFSNKEDLATLKNAWEDLSKEELNHDEIARSIAKVILEELGEEFPTSTCVIHENFNSSDIEVKYSDLMNMNFKGHHDPDKLSNAIFEILNY